MSLKSCIARVSLPMTSCLSAASSAACSSALYWSQDAFCVNFSAALTQGCAHCPASRFPLSTRKSATVNCARSEEHTSELQSHVNLVCRLLLEKKKKGRPHKMTKRTENIKYNKR